ncbi:hypothetical protein P692DRAFT_20758127, partial [Suillus brevipes Sb2]
LSIALENYRSWTVPTFTTYLHSCVMHTMAINMSLYDRKSGCRRVTGILFRMCDFWLVSHKYSTDIIHESGSVRCVRYSAFCIRITLH